MEQALTLTLPGTLTGRNILKSGTFRMPIIGRGDFSGLSKMEVTTSAQTRLKGVGCVFFSDEKGTVERGANISIPAGKSTLYLKATNTSAYRFVDFLEGTNLTILSELSPLSDTLNSPYQWVNLASLPKTMKEIAGVRVFGDINNLYSFSNINGIVFNASSQITGEMQNYIPPGVTSLAFNPAASEAVLDLKYFRDARYIWTLNTNFYLTGSSAVFRGKNNIGYFYVKKGNAHIDISDLSASEKSVRSIIVSSQDAKVSYTSDINFSTAFYYLSITHATLPTTAIDRLLNGLNITFANQPKISLIVTFGKSKRSSVSDTAVTNLLSKGAVITIQKA